MAATQDDIEAYPRLRITPCNELPQFMFDFLFISIGYY